MRQGGTLSSAPAVCISGELWKYAVGKVFLLNFILSSTIKKYKGGVSGLMIRTDPATAVWNSGLDRGWLWHLSLERHNNAHTVVSTLC